MRHSVTMLLIVLAFAKAYSQHTTATATEVVTLDKHPAIVVVDDFFRAFHKQDTIAMKNHFVEQPSVLSLSKRAKDETITYSTLDNLLQGIAGIPTTVSYEERLTAYEIIADDHIATVHTDYEFYLNGEVSHTGRNSFTLVYIDDQWKISQLMDTRLYE